MKALNEKELALIEQIFQLSQKQLLKAMEHYLKQKYDNVIVSHKYIVAIGDIPVALVSHLDTVFKQTPQDIFYDRVKNVMWSPDGLGADDRAGVYSILQILKTGLRPTIIFTTDEEKGCLGAEALVEKIYKAPTSLKYIIELDRNGIKDCVFYSCANEKFEEYVEEFDFETAIGSFSDISVICPAWGIAGVNLSIGYFEEHGYTEFLYVEAMNDTIQKVISMLKEIDEAPYFKYIPRPTLKTEWDPSYGISKKDWDSFMEPQTKCDKCGKWDYDYNMFPIKTSEGRLKFFCSDCVCSNDHVHWCSICGEPFYDSSFINKDDDIVFCEKCRGIINAKSKAE